MKRTVMITGCSTGIGREAAKYFAGQGWNVVATMRTPENASADLKKDNIFLAKLDVLDEKSIQSAISEGIRKFGCIDVVVNNAGFGIMGVFEPTSLPSIKKQFDTNVFGLMSVVREILPHFRKKKGGIIINISSVGGRTTFPLFSLYHSTKFAVEGFTESLQYELEGFNIRMKLVEPGAVLTDFGSRSLDRVELKDETYEGYSNEMIRKIEKSAKTGQVPVDVAKVIYQAATDRSKRMRYVSGGQAKALLVLRKLLPECVFRAFMRMSLKAL